MSGADTTSRVNDGYTREDIPCVICGVKDEEFQLTTPERLVKCKRCGLLYNNPRLDLESRKRIYSKEYFVIDHDDPGTDFKAYSNYIAEEPLIIKSVDRRMKKLESFTGSKGRMLDVGCATGFSLIAAQRRGWEAEGIEFAPFCVNYARTRGLAVHQGTLYDFPGEKASLDAITMWDYLEHSPNPLNDLIICNSLLKPGGFVMLSIPNVDSWSYHVFKQSWIGFKNIDHLYFFSRSSLAKLASMAGFTLESSFYHGRDVALSFFLARMKYYIRFKPLLNIIDKIANTPKIKRISFYMNPYDILNGVMRKV